MASSKKLDVARESHLFFCPLRQQRHSNISQNWERQPRQSRWGKRLFYFIPNTFVLQHRYEIMSRPRKIGRKDLGMVHNSSDHPGLKKHLDVTFKDHFVYAVNFYTSFSRVFARLDFDQYSPNQFHVAFHEHYSVRPKCNLEG